MLGLKFARLIEIHSDSLAASLVHQLHTNDRTHCYRKITADELRADTCAITGYIHHQVKESAKTKPQHTHA